MTAPSLSVGTSGSTQTMSSTASKLTSYQLQSRSTPNLKGKRPSLRGSFAAEHPACGDSSHTLPSVPAKKKKASSSLMKYPMKLLSSGKYPKARIVKDSIAMLDDEIQVMTHDAPFIDAVTADPSICLLDRKEVVLGELLGQGQFAQVYNVKDFKLREDRGEILALDEKAKRQSFVEDFHNCPNSHSGPCHSFAIKHLKKDLLVKPSIRNRRATAAAGENTAAGDSELPMDQQFQLAAADLVVEALYLSRLQHAHILKLRGVAIGGTAAFGTGRYDSYFLILDKLSETLDQRIRSWRRSMGQPREAQLCQKTEYAYQMAQALFYLHSRRIIFRDLKPSNVGFKELDDSLRIFDFGLCRELPPSRSAIDDDPNELYFMTAAGTHRYMAVEVHKGELYNQKADVYSWAMVYYELLAQEAPFLNFSEEDHQKLVCERQFRPKHFFGCAVPLSIQKLLDESWAHTVEDRLTMSEVVTRLEDILVNTFQQQLIESTER